MKTKKISAALAVCVLSVAFALMFNVKAFAADYTEIEDEEGYPAIAFNDGWEYQIKAKEAVVRGYTGTSKNLTVPDSVKYKNTTYPVGAIGKYAFSPYIGSSGRRTPIITNKKYTGENVESIVIPATIDTIGAYAFSGNKNISQVGFKGSSTLKIVGDYAFQGCTNIRVMVLPDSTEELGTSCFSGCEKIKSFEIPDKIRVIPGGCFAACSLLEKVTLNKKITALGGGAFSECTALKTINLPDTITTIGVSAFEHCELIQSIHIPTGLTAIQNYTFRYCYNLEGVSVPKNVKSIGMEAFAYCRDLATNQGKVTLREGLTTIGYRAFYDTPEMQSIQLPYSLVSVGTESVAFYNSEAGTRLVPGFTIHGYYNTATETYAKNNDIKFKGKAKTGVVLRYNGAEYVTTGKNTVELSGITSTYITTFEVPKKITVSNVTYKVTSVGAKAFADCKLLKTVKVQGNVTTIGKDAFRECVSLEKAVIGANVTKISARAFYRCSKLGSINIKTKKLKTVDKKAFKGISKKAKVTLPKSKKKAYKKLLKKAGIPASTKYK